MKRMSLLRTIAFACAVCAIGIFTSCDASWKNLEWIERLLGVDLKQASSGCGCGCLGQKAVIRINNDLNVDIGGVFIAPPEDTEWGENFLTELLPSGNIYETNVDAGLWDVGVVDVNDNVYYALGVQTSADTTTELYISNMTLYGTEDTEGEGETGPPVTVPDVVGMSQSDAETAIKEAGLEVGGVSKKFSNIIAEGHVVTQAPAADTVIPSGSAVSLAVAVADDLSLPDLETELAADEDPGWENYPDLDAEKQSIADVVDDFTAALKEENVAAAVVHIHGDKQVAYSELFNSKPEAMASFADLLSSATLNFLSSNVDFLPGNRIAEYVVDIDGYEFYITFMKVDGNWVLYEF